MSYRMISFSINFEDVVLQRAFPLDHRGFYIDIGAAHPVEQSDTKHFANHGWHGINVEPNPAQYSLLAADRIHDINLNIGVSNQSGELALFEAPGEACWSADRSFLTGYYAAGAESIVEHRVPVLTLAEICERYVPEGQVIDFLKIDVEGHEGAVIAGADWQRYRPRLIVAEATGAHEWDSVIRDAGYHFTLFDGVNRFYVRHEDADLVPQMSIPANISDSFGMFNYMSVINRFGSRISDLEQANVQLNELLERYKADAIHMAAAQAAQEAERRYPATTRIVRNVVNRFRRGA